MPSLLADLDRKLLPSSPRLSLVLKDLFPLLSLAHLLPQMRLLVGLVGGDDSHAGIVAGLATVAPATLHRIGDDHSLKAVAALHQNSILLLLLKAPLLRRRFLLLGRSSLQ